MKTKFVGDGYRKIFLLLLVWKDVFLDDLSRCDTKLLWIAPCRSLWVVAN